MFKSRYVIRNYQPEDFNKYVQLKVEAEKLEPAGRVVAPERLAEVMGRPNYSPGQDLFVAEKEKRITGYADVSAELTIEKANIDCWIHPRHRKKGLATELLDFAIARAREVGAKAVHANVMEDNKSAQDVLLKLGFEFVRRFNVLKLDMDEVQQEDMDKAAGSCRHLKQGEQDKLTTIQNLAFAEHWGYNPNTLEEITYHTTLSNFSPQDVVLACDGEKVIGYCWTGVTDEIEANTDSRMGLINMIGTDPDYRGKGIGRKVLLAGLARIKNKGLSVAVLAVDSENRIAGNLYRSVGFRKWKSSLWYEKSLD